MHTKLQKNVCAPYTVKHCAASGRKHVTNFNYFYKETAGTPLLIEFGLFIDKNCHKLGL